MTVITSRKARILELIVGDYIKTATPVASEAIVRNHDLGVSSATVRNEVAELENEGYITRPHTSAGSVPAEKGYRLYVDAVIAMRVEPVPPVVAALIRERLMAVEREIDEWTTVAAEVLARLVGNMAIVTFPKPREARVRQVQLVRLQDVLVLLIVVFEQARLRRQLFRLQVPVAPAQLQESANKLSEIIEGRTWREIGPGETVLSPLEEELLATTVVIVREEDRTRYMDHYVDGLRNLLRQPEFAENEQVRAVVEGVEDGSLAQAILEETPDTGVVRVLIGQENRDDMLRPLSVVIGQYGEPGQASGAVGAIGPTRMEYVSTISSVQYMTQVMTELFGSVQGG